MICILCLNSSVEAIHIFQEQGLNLDVSSIIVKHFWLEPSEGDSNAQIICYSCWNVLDSFHKFYKKIEAAHLGLIKHGSVLDAKLKVERESEGDVLDDAYTADFFSEDFKLEVEDSVVNVPQDETLPEVEKKVDPLEAFMKTNQYLDADSDSDLEIPLATLARVKRSKSLAEDIQTSIKTVNNDPPKLSPSSNEPATIIEQVQENTDSANDSDFSPSKPRARAKKIRRTKDQNKRVTCEGEKARVKRKMIDPVKKRQISHEFDEIIQKNIKLSCSICHVPLANFYLLRKHYHSIHNERGYATCCGRKFGKRGILVDHINTHLNPEYFKCVQCNRVLSDRRSLEVHMNTHGTSKERIFQCNQCNKSFHRKLMLDHHMYTHIPERTFTCAECQKMFSSEFTLRRHINNVHNIAFLKICEQCGKSFRGLEIFRRHQLEHAGVPIPLVPCEKCSVKLTTKYGLRRHMESMHPETEITHVCKTCGKKTPSAAALQRHISYMHKCERNHKCPMCDKAFKKSYNLKEHMTIHTGEVLYTCPHCPKTFNSNANMHSHRKKMHRKEWEENRRHPNMGAAPTTE